MQVTPTSSASVPNAALTYGFTTWTWQPQGPTLPAEAAVSGEMRATLCPVTPGQVIASVTVNLTVAAAGLTLARFAIYDLSAAPVLKASTATVHATVNGATGWNTYALSASYTVPAGVYGVYVAFLPVGVTPPQMTYLTCDDITKNNVTYSWRQLSQADLPGPATKASGNHGNWFALA